MSILKIKKIQFSKVVRESDTYAAAIQKVLIKDFTRATEINVDKMVICNCVGTNEKEEIISVDAVTCGQNVSDANIVAATLSRSPTCLLFISLKYH